MPPPRISSCLLTQLRSLSLSTRPILRSPLPQSLQVSSTSFQTTRLFSATSSNLNWLIPRRRGRPGKTHKGRPQCNTGGSIRGTLIAYGNWGIRLHSHDQRISAKHFQIAIDTLKRRLRGYAYTIYPRVVTNVAVYTSGNEQRMGKGKGSFDYWAARIAHGRVVLEVGGEVHEQVVKEALRIAGNKLPGKWEFVKKADGPVMGTTRWDQEKTSREELFKPKREELLHPLHKLADGTRAGKLSAGEIVPVI